MSVSEQPEPDSESIEEPSAVPRPFRLSKLWVAAGVVGLFAIYALATLLDVWVASGTDFEPDPLPRTEPRAAVVLGAAQYNGEPSPVLRARLDEAAELYEIGEVDLVVVTGGGQAADITTEAKSGYDYLREAGIPDGQLRLEVQGGSTYESLAATARILRDEDVVDVILVTDRYHAKRSLLIAREVGLEPRVSLTDRSASFERLVQESGAVAIGRMIGFRRLDRL